MVLSISLPTRSSLNRRRDDINGEHVVLSELLNRRAPAGWLAVCPDDATPSAAAPSDDAGGGEGGGGGGGALLQLAADCATLSTVLSLPGPLYDLLFVPRTAAEQDGIAFAVFATRVRGGGVTRGRHGMSVCERRSSAQRRPSQPQRCRQQSTHPTRPTLPSTDRRRPTAWPSSRGPSRRARWRWSWTWTPRCWRASICRWRPPTGACGAGGHKGWGYGELRGCEMEGSRHLAAQAPRLRSQLPCLPPCHHLTRCAQARPALAAAAADAAAVGAGGDGAREPPARRAAPRRVRARGQLGVEGRRAQLPRAPAPGLVAAARRAGAGAGAGGWGLRGWELGAGAAKAGRLLACSAAAPSCFRFQPRSCLLNTPPPPLPAPAQENYPGGKVGSSWAACSRMRWRLPRWAGLACTNACPALPCCHRTHPAPIGMLLSHPLPAADHLRAVPGPPALHPGVPAARTKRLHPASLPVTLDQQPEHLRLLLVTLAPAASLPACLSTHPPLPALALLPQTAWQLLDPSGLIIPSHEFARKARGPPGGWAGHWLGWPWPC